MKYFVTLITVISLTLPTFSQEPHDVSGPQRTDLKIPNMSVSISSIEYLDMQTELNELRAQKHKTLSMLLQLYSVLPDSEVKNYLLQIINLYY